MTVTAEDFIAKCAQVSETVGMLSGVGGMELAGQIVSVLSIHPEQVERFMREGAELFVDGTLDAKFGCLTYMAINGEVTSPSVLRAEKGASN
jgi:hypothetical protein